VAKKRKKKPDIKTPGTRLLDLTAGWMNFVVRERKKRVKDRNVKRLEVYDLYQQAGEAVFSDIELTPNEEREMVTRFVNERIPPILLR
jgi:hypothetical protein